MKKGIKIALISASVLAVGGLIYYVVKKAGASTNGGVETEGTGGYGSLPPLPEPTGGASGGTVYAKTTYDPAGWTEGDFIDLGNLPVFKWAGLDQTEIVGASGNLRTYGRRGIGGSGTGKTVVIKFPPRVRFHSYNTGTKRVAIYTPSEISKYVNKKELVFIPYRANKTMWREATEKL